MIVGNDLGELRVGGDAVGQIGHHPARGQAGIGQLPSHHHVGSSPSRKLGLELLDRIALGHLWIHRDLGKPLLKGVDNELPCGRLIGIGTEVEGDFTSLHLLSRRIAASPDVNRRRECGTVDANDSRRGCRSGARPEQPPPVDTTDSAKTGHVLERSIVNHAYLLQNVRESYPASRRQIVRNETRLLVP